MHERGGIEAGVHRHAIRVYYEDTDAAGIVYYANYLKFIERARTEMLRCLGLDHTTLRARFAVTFAVRRCVLDYHQPARLDDVLEVRSHVSALRRASIDLEQRVLRADALLVLAGVRLVLLNSQLRVARLPDALLDALAPLGEPRSERA